MDNGMLDIFSLILSGGVPMLLLFACFLLIKFVKELNTEVKEGLDRERKLEVLYRQEIKDQMQAQINLNKPMADCMAEQTQVMKSQEELMKRCNTIMQRVEILLAKVED